MKRLGVLVFFSLSLLVGQQARFSAPVLGYVYDPGARAIRSISGVPGSAGFDHTLASDLERTFISPAGDYAISHGEETLRLFQWSGRNVSEITLEVSVMPDEIEFSPSSKVAALYYKDPQIVEVWAGLPDAPKMVFRTPTETRMRAFAVSDDASAVVGAGESGLALINSDGERLIASGDFTAVAFLPGSLDVVAAQSALDQVLMFRNLALASVLAGPSEGVAGPVALGISLDARNLFVANGRAESLLRLNLETRQVSEIPCGCKPEVLKPLSGGTIFRVTETFKTRLFFLDGTAPNATVFVVAGGTQ